ncbi:MAG: DUF4037 domain-containing protein [Anaerolineae bacterium]
MVADFVPGLELNRRFYTDVVAPLLDGVEHAAARIGEGSDVLGFDDETSTDHAWGVRLIVFVAPSENTTQLASTLLRQAPPMFNSVRIEKEAIEVTTVPDFFHAHLGVDINGPLSAVDWLTFSEQSLLGLTTGAVYADQTGELGAAREKFAYYPHDIWLHIMAAGWRRIAQEEHLMGRAGMVGDDLGSRLITARLVRDIMHLCFLMERQYAPYAKWFGSAFNRLQAAQRIGPLLESVMRAQPWQERDAYLVRAYSSLAMMHNDLGVTEPLETAAKTFWERPMHVIYGDRFAQALRAAITDEAVRALPLHLGKVDQISSSTDVLNYPHHRRRLKGLWHHEDPL